MTALQRLAARAERLQDERRACTLDDLRAAGWLRGSGRDGRNTDSSARWHNQAMAERAFDEAAERAFAARRKAREAAP